MRAYHRVSMSSAPLVSRRALLLGGVAALAGCADTPRTGAERRAQSSPRPPLPSPARPPTPPPYVPPPGDALPNFKLTAGRFAQSLGTYEAGRGPLAAGAPAGFVGSPSELSAAAAPMVQQDVWSRGEIEFVQYGGLTPVSANARSGVAMVVMRQVLHSTSGDTTVVRRVLDVRLVQQQGAWRVEALASAGGSPLPPPVGLPAASESLLRDDRVDLPDSARWDLYSGQISVALVEVLSILKDVAPFRATVLRTGHPERVVDGRAAAPVSAHWLGRAVDLNALNGVPIASAATPDLRRFIEAAGALPQVAQIGAPVGLDLDGRGSRRYFSNLVHADHLHIAVKGAGPTADQAGLQLRRTT